MSHQGPQNSEDRDISNESSPENAQMILDERFIYDTYSISHRVDGKKFEAGKFYSILFEYSTVISTGNTGVFCSIDPDILKKHKNALEQFEFKDLSDLAKISD